MCARLWIPKSFIDGIRRTDRCHIRARVGHFQYQALMGVHRLRGELIQAAARPTQAEWLTPLHVVQVQPRPTRERLRTQIGAPWAAGKRRAPTTERKRTASTAVDEWNADLHGDLDAQAALTRILADRRATKRRSTDLHALMGEVMETLAGTFAAAVDELKVMAGAWTLLKRTPALLADLGEIFTSARREVRHEGITGASTMQHQFSAVTAQAEAWLLRTHGVEMRVQDLHVRMFHEHGFNPLVQRAKERLAAAAAHLEEYYQASAHAVEEHMRRMREAWVRRMRWEGHRASRRASLGTSPVRPAKRRRLVEEAEGGDVVVLTGETRETAMVVEGSDAIILTGEG